MSPNLNHRVAEVAFEVHHLADRTGYLLELHQAGGTVPGLGRKSAETAAQAGLSEGSGSVSVPATQAFFETLSPGAYGTGLVIRTGVRPADQRLDGSAAPGSGGAPAMDTEDPATWVFHGTAQPNPSLLYDSPTALEGLIAVEVEPRRLLTLHGEAVREIITRVAEMAVSARCPLLYLQSPAQLPHRNRPPDDPPHAYKEAWGRSSSHALRFALAIGRRSSAERSVIADSLAEFCVERGLGLWLRDSRPAHRSGNWFAVVPYQPEGAKAYRSQFAVSGQGQRMIQRTCPLTFVGPARVGSTHAIFRMLGLYQPAPLAAVSVASLDDLAFIHLQLALPMRDRASQRQTRERLADWLNHGQADPVSERLPALLDALGHDRITPQGQPVPEEVIARADDYQMFAGPIVMVDDPALPGRPLWVSWDVERSSDGMAAPLMALALALGDVGLMPSVEAADGSTALGTNIEYLLCRDTGNATLRAKGKLKVPDALWKELLPHETPTVAARLLAQSLEAAWQARRSTSERLRPDHRRLARALAGALRRQPTFVPNVTPFRRNPPVIAVTCGFVVARGGVTRTRSRGGRPKRATGTRR